MSNDSDPQTDGELYRPPSVLSHLSAILAPLLSQAPPGVLPRQIPSSLPIQQLAQFGLPLEEVASHLTSHVVPYLNASSLSPNYYGFVTGGATPAALTGDILASVYDQNVAVHLPQESIATTVEATTLNMLLDLFNLPRAAWKVGHSGAQGGSGTFTTGATASNVLGLALGREHVLRSAAQRVGRPMTDVSEHGLVPAMAAAGIDTLQVLSTMPHSSIAKAASILGIGRGNVASIFSPNDPLTIDLAKLESVGSTPRSASILVISAGEVNTGRFATTSASQMARIREICDKHGIWIHVDGAFGLFGRILSSSSDSQTAAEFAAIVEGTAGLELADSITGDAHKLLNVPYDCGFFFTRHKCLAEDVFQNGNAPYLTPATAGADGDDGIQSPLNIGIENSRRFRALPVYATLLQYGREGYVELLQRQIRLARRVAAWLHEHEEFELLPRARDGEGLGNVLKRVFMIVLFRARDERVNEDLVQRINGTGRLYVSSTSWEGTKAARIAVSNWRVDVERDGKIVEEVLESVLHEIEWR